MGDRGLGAGPLAPHLDPGLNQRLIHPGGHAQLGDLPVPGGVPLVLAIAECQACALSQQGSPPGGGPLQLSDRSGFLFGCQPPAVTGWCRRSDGRCDDEAIGSETAHKVRVELVFETPQDPPSERPRRALVDTVPVSVVGASPTPASRGRSGSLEAAIDTGGRWRRPLLALGLGECRPGSIDPACSLHSDPVPTVGLSKELMTILVLSSSEREGVRCRTTWPSGTGARITSSAVGGMVTGSGPWRGSRGIRWSSGRKPRRGGPRRGPGSPPSSTQPPSRTSAGPPSRWPAPAAAVRSARPGCSAPVWPAGSPGCSRCTCLGRAWPAIPPTSSRTRSTWPPGWPAGC